MNITKSQAKALLELLQSFSDLKDILDNCPDYFENVSCECNADTRTCENCWKQSIKEFIEK
jgi:hypothetical protein